jgi:hypothetical protein
MFYYRRHEALRVGSTLRHPLQHPVAMVAGGQLPVPARQTSTGTILVMVELRHAGRLVVYAWMSSHQQPVDLDRQVARVTQWPPGRAWRWTR